MTREEAKQAGVRIYFPGACRHGHDEGFYVSVNKCVGCIKERTKKNYDPERCAVLNKLWRQNNPDRARKNRKIWLSNNQEYTATWMRQYHQKRKYNLTMTQRQTLFAAQGERCAICHGDDPRSKIGWVTDHDHQTGEVRGILCHHCNYSIGVYEKRILPQLENVTNYLNKNNNLVGRAA